MQGDSLYKTSQIKNTLEIPSLYSYSITWICLNVFTEIEFKSYTLSTSHASTTVNSDDWIFFIWIWLNSFRRTFLSGFAWSAGTFVNDRIFKRICITTNCIWNCLLSVLCLYYLKIFRNDYFAINFVFAEWNAKFEPHGGIILCTFRHLKYEVQQIRTK